MGKSMDILAQYGNFGQLSPWGCSLYGLLLMVASVWLAIHTKKPEKEEIN
jgi:hypothetical protein